MYISIIQMKNLITKNKEVTVQNKKI